MTTKGTVLVIDDSILVLEFCSLVLQSEGFEVITLDSPLRLPVIAKEVRPDVVLLDVKMPALKGDRALRLSKEFGFLDSTAVILHSDMPETELAELAASSGATGYLAKTEDTSRFIRAVERWVEHVKAIRSSEVPSPPDSI